ncbi:hypothetical protein Ciccas_010039 [Cichlidogyrus casuarinus]|uniref:Uncharacterized protein n=1 Tax=Cichlidogyrus casuarinus TaxID=1844966 RepID=A0ABD2PY46_9PLAT
MLVQNRILPPKDQKQAKCRRSSTIIRDKLSHLRQFVVAGSGSGTSPISPSEKSLSPAQSLGGSTPASPVSLTDVDKGELTTCSVETEDVAFFGSDTAEEKTEEKKEDMSKIETESTCTNGNHVTKRRAPPPPVSQEEEEIEKSVDLPVPEQHTAVTTITSMSISEPPSRRLSKKKRAPKEPYGCNSDSDKTSENNSGLETPSTTSSGWKFSLREKIGVAFNALTSSSPSTPNTPLSGPKTSKDDWKTTEGEDGEAMYNLPLSALTLLGEEPVARPEKEVEAGSVVGNGYNFGGSSRKTSITSSNILRMQQQIMEQQMPKRRGEKVAVMTTVSQSSTANFSSSASSKGIPIQVVTKISGKQNFNGSANSSAKKFWKFG